jgi:hypothetical protein
MAHVGVSAVQNDVMNGVAKVAGIPIHFAFVTLSHSMQIESDRYRVDPSGRSFSGKASDVRDGYGDKKRSKEKDFSATNDP